MVNVCLLAAVLELAAPFGNFKIEVPEFAARDFPVTRYGAKPDGTKCTAAFARAMAACEKAGGGTVTVPAGTWLTGAVRFRNNCNLHLEKDAVLEFTDDPADYPEVHTTWEGIECYNHSPLLFAYGVTNVAITGSGTIAPRMDFWRTWFARPPEHMKATEHLYFWCSTNAPMASRRLLALDRAHMRPHLIQFNRCGNVLLDGFRIRESPFWMIHLYHSENCVVRNLDTYAHGHNNDGVDVDMTRNVLIEKCHFDQGDDGVVLKAGRNADAWRLGRCTENVVVRDCDMVKSHSLLGIGSELSGGVRNVWMTRCTVGDTYSMLRIKTGPRRGGFVENVWMDNCRGERMIRVFNIFTSYCAQWGAFPDFELRRTRIANIHLRDCEARLAAFGIQLKGDPELPPSGIEIDNVRIGRAFHSFTDVTDCEDVRMSRLSLAPKGTVDFTPDRFVAEGSDAGEYEANGSWRKIISRVRPGDHVILRFPPSPARDRLAAHARDQGGVVIAESPETGRDPFKVEHVAMDVADPAATAAWWCRHLGFKVTMRKTDATGTTFVVDRTGGFAMEFYRAKDSDRAPDYAKMSTLRLHVAFLSDDVDADVARMVKAGATLVVREKAPGFDGAMLRDPSGIPLQFVKRGKSVLR